jgi:hypothetical protein
MLSPHITTNCEILNVIVSRILLQPAAPRVFNVRKAYIRRLSACIVGIDLAILTVPRLMVERSPSRSPKSSFLPTLSLKSSLPYPLRGIGRLTFKCYTSS